MIWNKFLFRNVGITGVTIANNHIDDYRTAGVKETVRLLDKYDIPYTGVNFGRDPYAVQVYMNE